MNNPTFVTRTSAVEYMVSKGAPIGRAKAAIDQQYNYDKDGETGDELRDIDDATDQYVAISVTAEELMNVWVMWDESYLSDDEHGIYVDGVLTYDVNGNLLRK